MNPSQLPHVLVIGGGITGAFPTRAFASASVRIDVADR